MTFEYFEYAFGEPQKAVSPFAEPNFAKAESLFTMSNFIHFQMFAETKFCFSDVILCVERGFQKVVIIRDP